MGAESAPPLAEPALPPGTHIDPAGQLAFLRRWYLGAGGGFVREGGAKIKLLLGRPGAGKTHFLAALLAAAREEGFLAVHVDCRQWPLWGFDQIYRALVASVDLAELSRRFSRRVLTDLGYDGASWAAGQTLAVWAAARGHDPAPLRARYEEDLYRRLLRNADLDYGYALGLSLWCTRVAWGAAPGDPGDTGGMLEHWLRGGRLAARDCNRLRLRRPADRFTARLWLRSLLHFIRLAGLPGLVAAFDGTRVILERGRREAAPLPVEPAEPGGTGPEGAVGAESLTGAAEPLPHYTRGRRDDFYECLRALIDDMGLTPGLLLAFAGPPELLSDERSGFLSYQALAERVRSEVETVELNRFGDEIALERLWAADPDSGRLLAERLLAAVAPEAGEGLREQALAAAQAQWTARDVTVSAVRRSVLAVLRLAREGGVA